jgi:hypothetical protein
MENRNMWTEKGVQAFGSFIVPSSSGSRMVFVDCCIQGMRKLGNFETSINAYQSTRPNI